MIPSIGGREGIKEEKQPIDKLFRFLDGSQTPGNNGDLETPEADSVYVCVCKSI